MEPVVDSRAWLVKLGPTEESIASAPQKVYDRDFNTRIVDEVGDRARRGDVHEGPSGCRRRPAGTLWARGWASRPGTRLRRTQLGAVDVVMHVEIDEVHLVVSVLTSGPAQPVEVEGTAGRRGKYKKECCGGGAGNSKNPDVDNTTPETIDTATSSRIVHGARSAAVRNKICLTSLMVMGMRLRADLLRLLPRLRLE
jgi:hypothetical protein